MKKRTQHEIITLYLLSVGDWVPSYRLVKQETAWGWIGLQGDRRAYELVKEGCVVDTVQYTIEHRKNGKYAEYRIKNFTPTKSPTPSLVYDPVGDRMVRV